MGAKRKWLRLDEWSNTASIDPDFVSGRPVIKGTEIAAEIIAKRKGSGESEARLAKDYRISRRAVKEAVRYFTREEAA